MKWKISDLTRKLVGASTLAVGLLLTQNAAAAPMYDASRWTNRLTFFTSYLTAGTHIIQTDTRPYGGADTVLHVLDTSLHQVAMNDDYLPWLTTGRNDSYLSFTAPTTGSYRILVRAYNSQGEARTNVIVDGATVLTNQPFGSYSVAAQWNAGDEFRAATASYGGSNDLLGFALDGAGNVIAGDDDSGPNFYSFLTLPSAGSGTLLRAGYPGQNYFGSTATLQAPPNAGNDSDGDGLTNSLESVIGTSMFNEDSDTDAIPDGMEILGNNGWSFSENGDAKKRNIWVEVDYMLKENLVSGPYSGQTGPQFHDLGADMTAIFRDDGNVITTVVVDQQIPYTKIIGFGGCGTTTQCVPFTDLKTDYFSPGSLERRAYFHYALFGDSYGGYNAGLNIADVQYSSGVATGQNVVVTVGNSSNFSNLPNEQLGGAMHELGHNLALGHNGNDGAPYARSESAHRSVMNYRYTMSGVPTPWGSTTTRHTYSFGTAACDPCMTSPKQSCVDARNAGACATNANCDCDVIEWGNLDTHVYAAAYGTTAGVAGSEMTAALRRNQDNHGRRTKSEPHPWKGAFPAASLEAQRARVAEIARRHPTEVDVSADGLDFVVRERNHAPRK